MTTQHGTQEFLTTDPILGDECDWHRRYEPSGVRKCDRQPVVVRDGYGGTPLVRFCAEHDPIISKLGLSEVPTHVLRRELERRGEA